MLYGLLTYEEAPGHYNLGDHVQSLAARQYLPRVDALLNRERLGAYDGPSIKLIMNGWFTHNAANWVPAPAIIPHFVSFHINSSAADRILSPRGLEYLRRHAPIGCRDHHTVGLLRSRGVDAYFTGCLTLTLTDFAADSPRRDETILVDPFFNLPSLHRIAASPRSLARALIKGELLGLGRRRRLLRRAFTKECLDAMARVTQELPSRGEPDERRFARAEACLRRYAQAKFVVTSRIHCALPCLAMGTPVIFLNAFDSFVDTCRFEGLLELFNRVDYAPDGAVSTNFGTACPLDGQAMPANPTRHVELAARLRESCRRFVST